MANRKPFIAGNWKMHKTCTESVETAKRLKEIGAGLTDIDIMIAPAFTSLYAVFDVLKGSNILLGAQNVFWKNEGAYTGEVSPVMLTSVGCIYAIIGHSERRSYFQESDELINQKIAAAARNGLIPVFCIGETEQERDADKTKNVLDKQLTKGLQDIALDDLKTLVVAYEPVWAIGTGKSATTEQAQDAHAFIRGKLNSILGSSMAEQIRILYGGSVKPGNIGELMKTPDIDGALVGGASLEADTFGEILKYRG